MSNPITWAKRVWTEYQEAQTIRRFRPPWESAVLPDQALADYSNNLDFLGMSFADVFLAEQRDDIRRCIFALFPDMRWNDDVNSTLANLGIAASHSNLGRIQRENNYPPVGHLRTASDLPCEVRYIDVVLWQATDMPSLVFLGFHAALEECVKTDVLSFLTKSYSGTPDKRNVFSKSISFTNPNLQRESQIDDYLWRLKSRIQRWLRRYLTDSYFSSFAHDLPQLDILAVSSMPQNSSNEWLASTRPWRDALGLDLELYGFGGGDGAIVPAKSRLGSDVELPWRLIISTDTYGEQSWGFGRLASYEKAVWDLFGLLTLICVARYEEGERALIFEVRRRMRAIDGLGFVRWVWVPSYFSLSERVIGAREICRRIQDESRALFAQCCGLAALLERPYRLVQDGLSLRIEKDWLPRLLVRDIASIDAGLNMAREYLLDILSVRNLAAILIISFSTLLASIVAIVVALKAH